MKGCYIGLMAGTSLDGVDAVVVAIEDQREIRQIAWLYTPYPAPLANELRRFCFAADIPLAVLCELDARLGEYFAHVCLTLLEQAGLGADDIQAIGSHGQTLYHHPHGSHPSTLQIGDPNRIAELTGITTVADFRRRDMAAGGQGAPLVPAFHQALFASPAENRAVLNLGGIANLTLLPADSGIPVTGFDTGPGNTLMNRWILHHLGRPYDEGGEWAASGRCLVPLLDALLADPYFSTSPPKSTGPEYFSLEWLERHLGACPDARPEDVQATLAQLTAVTVSDQLRRVEPLPQRLLVCGGGIHNRWLMALLQDLTPCPLESTTAHGIDPDRVEATAFAWLACQTLAGQPGNLPSVTGARRSVVLGGIYNVSESIFKASR